MAQTTCTPLRFDHLERNTVPHTISQAVRDSAQERVWLCYTQESTPTTVTDAVFIRSYDIPTATLGSPVEIVTEAATGHGCTSPHLLRLPTGRMIVAYDARSGAVHQGVWIKESTDDGLSWGAEHELLMGTFNPPNPDLHRCVGLLTDGVDVFAITMGEIGSAPILVYRRRATGDWTDPNRIFVGSGTNYFEFRELSSGGPAGNADVSKIGAVKKVGSNPDTWHLVLVGGRAGPGSGNNTKVAAYYNAAWTDSDAGLDTTANWTQVTVHDFGAGTNHDPRPITVQAQLVADELRTSYTDLGVPIGVYGAFSTNFGQAWTDIGKLTVPNANHDWDPSWDVAFTIDRRANWFLGTVRGFPDISAFDNLHVYKGDDDTDDNWSEVVDCDVVSPFSDSNVTNRVTENITCGTTYLQWISDTGTSATNPPDVVHRIWLITQAALAENGVPPGEQISDKRLWRRGTIQAVRSTLPQQNAFSAAPIERLDTPGSLG